MSIAQNLRNENCEINHLEIHAFGFRKNSILYTKRRNLLNVFLLKTCFSKHITLTN